MNVGEEGVVSINGGDASSPKPQVNNAQRAPLEIRTMRDDLADARRSGNTAAPKTGAPGSSFQAPIAPPKPPQPSSTSSVTGGVAEDSDRNPLAGKVAQAPAATPLPPSGRQLLADDRPKKKGDKVLIILIVLFVVTALGAAGVWAWIFLGNGNGGEEIATPTVTEPKAFNEVIPADSMMVAHYNVQNPSVRASVQTAWDAHTTGEATMSAALTGDPRLFLQQASLTSFNYVLLPGDPRFYVVLEGDDSIDEFLAQYTNVQVFKYAQWRILHSFSTDLYEQRLVASNVMPPAQQIIASFDEPLTTYIAGDLLKELYDDDKAKTFVSSVEDMLIAVSYGVEGNANVVRVESKGNTVAPAIGVEDASILFTHIPADAQFVRSGPSFSNEISDFTKPYAYYERIGDDGLLDAGLVTTIPESLRPSVVLGDTSIETALPKLLEVGSIGPLPAAELTFIDSEYAGVPLRYVNVSTPEKALDYAIAGEQLLTATSKEGMFAALDAATSGADTTLADTVLGSLEALTSPLGADRVFGELTQPSLKKLLPGGSQVDGLQFSVAYQVGVDQSAISGVIALPELGGAQ